MKQKLLMMMLALGMCSIGVNAQKREHKVEKDGFEWYEIADKDWHYGAENVNGGMIIPYGNYYIRYNSYNNLKHFLLSTKNTEGETEYGVYNIRGKEIIPLSRHYTWIIGLDSYYQVSTKTYSGICDKNGKEICKATGIKSVYAYYKSGRFYYEFSKNNLMGIMDGNGKIIVPAQWDAVWVEGNYIVGSKKGKEIKIKPISSITTKNNLLAVKEDMKDYTISPSSYASSSSSSSSDTVFDFIFDLYTKKSANADINPIPKMPKNEEGSFNEYIVRIELNASSIDYKILIVDRKNNDRTTILESYSITPSSGSFAILSDGIQFCEYDNGKPRGVLIRDDVTTVGKWDGTTFVEGWFFPQLSFYSNVGGTLGNTIAMYKGIIEGFNKNTNFSHTQAGETDFHGKYTKLKNALQKYNWKKVVR